MCFAIAISQQFVHLPIWVMHWARSVHFLSDFWAFFLLPSYRSVSNLYRSCLRVGQGCTIPPRFIGSLCYFHIYYVLPILFLAWLDPSVWQGGYPVSSPDESTGSWLLSLLLLLLLLLPYLLTQTAESLPRLPPPFSRLGRGSCLPLPPLQHYFRLSNFSISQNHC